MTGPCATIAAVTGIQEERHFMQTRERLHILVNAIPEDDLDAVERLLSSMQPIRSCWRWPTPLKTTSR